MCKEKFHRGGVIVRKSLLDWRFPFGFVALFLGLGAPVALWMNWTDPVVFQFFRQPWPSITVEFFAMGCAATLFCLPLVWVLSSRVLDLFAFFLAQNALLVSGYFFLGTTAWRLETFARDILQNGSLVVAVNALGFAMLFASMGAIYFLAWKMQARLPALRASPEEYDARLTWFLRAAGIGVAFVLCLPMVKTGVIPMLAEDPVAARTAMQQSDLQRALYNLGTALMPFVTGGLMLLCTRKPLRIFGPDGWIVGMILLIQLLSGNRFPLAVAFFVTITLVTVERKWPRPLLVVGYVAFMVLLTGVSGFTGILRQDREALEGTNVVAASLEQAFVGDNLIDTRDAAWVFSQWDFEPLMGQTYLGGLVSMMPSGIFPQKKQWHLGLTGIRIVGWDPERHFGLRITFFGESFLNFGPAGVVGLGFVMGCLFGALLRVLHLISRKKPPCLHYSLKTVILMQMCMPLANTSDAFTFWAMGAFVALQWMCIDLPILYRANRSNEILRASSRI